jgi:hypothetical protein
MFDGPACEGEDRRLGRWRRLCSQRPCTLQLQRRREALGDARERGAVGRQGGAAYSIVGNRCAKDSRAHGRPCSPQGAGWRGWRQRAACAVLPPAVRRSCCETLGRCPACGCDGDRTGKGTLFHARRRSHSVANTGRIRVHAEKTASRHHRHGTHTAHTRQLGTPPCSDTDARSGFDDVKPSSPHTLARTLPPYAHLSHQHTSAGSNTQQFMCLIGGRQDFFQIVRTHLRRSS